MSREMSINQVINRDLSRVTLSVHDHFRRVPILKLTRIINQVDLHIMLPAILYMMSVKYRDKIGIQLSNSD